jgi:hypothetical protein
MRIPGTRFRVDVACLTLGGAVQRRALRRVASPVAVVEKRGGMARVRDGAASEAAETRDAHAGASRVEAKGRRFGGRTRRARAGRRGAPSDGPRAPASRVRTRRRRERRARGAKRRRRHRGRSVFHAAAMRATRVEE